MADEDTLRSIAAAHGVELEEKTDTRKARAEELRRELAALERDETVADKPGDGEPEDKLAGGDDLDDEQVQHRIFHPLPEIVKLSYGEVTLYPFSVRERCNAYGFCVETTASAGVRSNSSVTLGMQIAAAVNRNPGVMAELFRLAAVASRPAGELKPKRIEQIANEFADRCSPQDRVLLLTAITKISGANEPSPKIDS